MEQRNLEFRLFDEDQLAIAREELVRAGKLMADFYRFSPREWFHYSYELFTSRDFHGDAGLTDALILAEVLRREPSGETVSGQPPHYGVRLYDPNILRKSQGLATSHFRFFLLYILTHELVHIARFSHRTDFHAADEHRSGEEEVVRGLTRLVLRQVAWPEMDGLVAHWDQESRGPGVMRL